LHHKASSSCWTSWLHKRRIAREVCSRLFHKNSSSYPESEKKEVIKEQESKVLWTYISSHSCKGVVSVKVWGRLFIARAPEEIEMKELEKTETKDARSVKRGNR
jgi:hypothetical protein